MKSSERSMPLRLSVPARPPLHKPTTSTTPWSARHYPSYPNVFTPSSASAKPLPFSPSPIATPSKRPRANPYLPWLCKLLELSSLYLLNSWLKNPDNPNSSSSSVLSLAPFTFLALLLSALLTALLQRQPPRNRSLTLPNRLTLGANGFLLALLFLVRFHGCRACGPMEAVLAEFAGALAGKALLSDAKSSERGKRIRGSVALVTGLFLLSHGWDRAGCFPATGSYSDSCSKLFPMLAPLAAGFMASLERSWANRSSVRHLESLHLESVGYNQPSSFVHI